MHRRLRSVAARTGLAALVAAALPLAGAGPAGAATACRRPPLTVTVLPGPIGTTGPADLTVTDAVARRVPIVPDPDVAADDPEALAALRARAARTRLALYTMYLADFRVPRKELSGFGFGEVSAPRGKTVAAVTVVPTDEDGFRAGDVVEVAPFEYDATTTFAPLSLVVNSSGQRATYAYDGVEGSVRVRTLTKKALCLDIDVRFTRRGETVASAAGTVKAPVVKADPAFFYT